MIITNVSKRKEKFNVLDILISTLRMIILFTTVIQSFVIIKRGETLKLMLIRQLQIQ